MEAKASKHASKCEHACARSRVCVCERVRVRARSLMATLPGGGHAEDGSELRSHACGVATVEARGHAPGVGRIVIDTVTPREVRPYPGRPPATSGGLGFLVPDLNSGPSEGHLNMRDDQSQVGPLGSRTPASPRGTRLVA